jgi:hypothetical protein
MIKLQSSKLFSFFVAVYSQSKCLQMFCSMSPFLEMAYILHGVLDLKVDNKNFLLNINN